MKIKLAIIGAAMFFAALQAPGQINIGSGLTYAWPGATGATANAPPQQLAKYLVMNPYGPRIATSTLTWTITGTAPNACTFSLQGSPDATTWANLDGGSAVSCTATNSEVVTGALPNYLRIYVRTFTQGDSTTVATFSYQGSTSSGSYTLPVASTSVLGGVKPDGSTCTVNATTGVLTCGGGITETCDASTVANYQSAVCIFPLTNADILNFDGTTSTGIDTIAAPGAGRVTIFDGNKSAINTITGGQAGDVGNSTIKLSYGPNGSLTYAFCTLNTDYTANWWGLCAVQGVEGNFDSPSTDIADLPIEASANVVVSQGPIATSSVTSGNAGLLYAANDTGTITTFSGDATYVVNSVGVGGNVLTYTLTAPGSVYGISTGNATATGGAQPGSGTGFEVDINSVLVFNGSAVLTLFYTVVPIS